MHTLFFLCFLPFAIQILFPLVTVSSYLIGFFYMWAITEMEVGETVKRKKTICVILRLFLHENRLIIIFFGEALQIKLSSKNILIELGWTEDGSLVQLYGVIYAFNYSIAPSKRRRQSW